MIGVDLETVERIKKLCASDGVMRKVFTSAEIDYAFAHTNQYERLCGFYCAKEAFAKAVGTGFRGIAPIDIEVVHEESGAPRLKFYRAALDAVNNKKVEVSISHSGGYAVAVVNVLEN